MPTARIRISAPLLRELLELPDDVKIIGDETGNIMLTVEGQQIPDGYEEVLPSWRILTRDRDHKPTVTEFIGFQGVVKKEGNDGQLG